MFPTKEFKIEMIKHDLTAAQIGRRLGTRRIIVTQVINNLGTSQRIRDFLYRLLYDMRSGKFKRLEDY